MNPVIHSLFHYFLFVFCLSLFDHLSHSVNDFVCVILSSAQCQFLFSEVRWRTGSWWMYRCFVLSQSMSMCVSVGFLVLHISIVDHRKNSLKLRSNNQQCVLFFFLSLQIIHWMNICQFNRINEPSKRTILVSSFSNLFFIIIPIVLDKKCFFFGYFNRLIIKKALLVIAEL